jgi:DNA-binding response OmpR family regulator
VIPADETRERLSVLYVEDDERLARLTAQYLRSHNVEVTVVARGDLALGEVLRTT